MRRSLCNTLRIILALAVALSFLAGTNKPVQAETCTWEGDGNTDWMLAGNWTCGHVPGPTDTVNIPVVTNFPVIYTNVDIPTPPVLSLTIEPGAFLTINQGMALDATTMTVNGTLVANAASSPIFINVFTPTGVVNVGSSGSITKQGAGNLYIYSTFNNAGTVTFTEHGSGDGGVVLIRGGAHTGIFQGEYLFVGNNDVVSGQIFNFNTGSQIRVNKLHARGGTVNLSGSISQPESSGTALFVQPSSGTSGVVYFRTGLGILKMPETTFIEYGGKLILEAQSYDYSMQKLNLEYNGELQNNNALTITTQFNWKAGKITGVETTTVDTSATFTMGTSVYAANDFTLDGQTLVNNATANWNKRDLTLANSAEFINNGTFNANATTTMTGGETVTFTNNGNFYKNTPETTTTMNVGFVNDGLVQVNAGSLVFPLGMDNGDNTTLNLNGGTLDPGETLNLEVGDSLIGSGTLAANLVNGGTVSPGESPGTITVDGDYTQQTDGTLEIQLGGTTTDLFDQLIVTGAATMNGTLTVTLLPGFTPQEGDTFFIIDHSGEGSSGTGTFDTVNLPDLPGGLSLEADFLVDGVTLTVEGVTCTWSGSTSVDWETATNWICSDGTSHVPITTDNVVIPDTSNDPVYSETLGFDLNAIEIQAGATLKIANAYNIRLDAMTWQIDGTLWFKPTDTWLDMEINPDYRDGVVNIGPSGDLDLDCEGGVLRIYSTFNNAGMVESLASAQGIALMGSGVHTGSFADLPVLQLAAVDPEAEFLFQLDSVLTLNLLNVTSGHAFIYGSYQRWETTIPTRLNIDASNLTYPPSVTIESASVTMPEYTVIASGTTLTVNSPLSIPRLSLAGTLNNTSLVDVTGSFYWYRGGFTGDSTTTVEASATSTINLNGTATMDAQTLTLDGTTNWAGNNITLSNGAEIINNSTFNANATTTMNGGETEFFTNNGSFIKKTDGTTTTMNIPFTNNGTVEVVAGTLVFQQGMDNGQDAVIDLGGGTLDPGDNLTLESGDSLIGSGTLAANLVNAGTVSPGASPGIITVDGDYTQQLDGILEIQLGGTSASLYDQLIVTGAATLQGTLNVTLMPGFTPQAGDTFFIIDHSGEGSSGTGDFDTINLPDLAGGLEMEIDFADPGLTLNVVDSGGSVGSISGTVTCDSTHTVFVDLYSDSTTPPPADTVQIACGESYSFTELPDGTYYVGAWIDLNDSGDGPPDEGEPSAWYGDPTAVTIVDGQSHSGIDISFPTADTGSIEGTVTCDSTHTVFVDLYSDSTTPPPADTVQIACGESYSFTELPDGTYYVGAWIDLNDSGGGPPDEGEPSAWYGDPTAVTIVDGQSHSGIDISFPAESFQLFMPLILR